MWIWWSTSASARRCYGTTSVEWAERPPQPTPRVGSISFIQVPVRSKVDSLLGGEARRSDPNPQKCSVLRFVSIWSVNNLSPASHFNFSIVSQMIQNLLPAGCEVCSTFALITIKAAVTGAPFSDSSVFFVTNVIAFLCGIAINTQDFVPHVSQVLWTLGERVLLPVLDSVPPAQPHTPRGWWLGAETLES